MLLSACLGAGGGSARWTDAPRMRTMVLMRPTSSNRPLTDRDSRSATRLQPGTSLVHTSELLPAEKAPRDESEEGRVGSHREQRCK